MNGKKLMYIGLITILVISALVMPASAGTYYVPDDVPDHIVHKINWLVCSLIPTGSTIFVRDGTYEDCVNVYRGPFTIRSLSGPIVTTVAGWPSNGPAFEIRPLYGNCPDNTIIEGFSIYYISSPYPWGEPGLEQAGIGLRGVSGCTIKDNRCGWNDTHYNHNGIRLDDSSNNNISGNICNSNDADGIRLRESMLGWGRSNNNIILGNTANENDHAGIYLYSSIINTISGNTCNENNGYGIHLVHSDYNTISGNTCNENDLGMRLYHSSNNVIYLNSFKNNNQNVYSEGSTNIWNSPSRITYTYKGNTYTNYLGNYWDDYTGTDANGDGIGDTPYIIPNDNNDSYPLMEPQENYIIPIPGEPVETATGTGTAYFASDAGTIEDLASVNESDLPSEGKPALVFPHGFFSFNITGLTPGQTVVVTITLPDNVPVGTQYWKYHASEGGWIQIPMDSDDGDNVITITLVDGGLGDDDGTANGVIVDQGGPGIPGAPPEITFFAPPSPVNDTVCNWRRFNITVNQTVNVDWYLDDSLLHTNESVRKASCRLHADSAGAHNVTAIASNANGTDMQTWVWKVTKAADLVITDKWLCWPDNCTICYNVTNIGEGTAPACHNTTLYVDSVEVAYDHVPVDLAPGESYIGCFDGYTWTYTPPSDNITVCADNNEALVELDEDNNCLANIWMCGDVNGDRAVNVIDVVLIYKRALDPGYPLDLPWAGDVNCDCNINVIDVVMVYKRALDPGYDLDCCCEVV